MKRAALCHPDKPHKGRGLCNACLKKKRLNDHPELRIKKNEAERKRRAKNPGAVAAMWVKWHAENPGKRDEARKAWAFRNPGHANYRAQRRRARLLDSSSPGVPSEVFLQKCKSSDYRCWYCMKKCDRLEREHIVPISRGGQDSPSNVIPACKGCNSSKHNKLLHEWLDIKIPVSAA